MSGQKRDSRGICQHPVYRHCSVVHGHLRASSTLRSDALASHSPVVPPGTSVPWDIIAFPHIPKTGGHAFKTTMLKVLSKATRAGKKAINIRDGAALFKEPTGIQAWDPPRFLHGAFSGDACRWLREGKGGNKTAMSCGYITIFRDPVDRMISELNYCEEVGWFKEQACTGGWGAVELRDHVSAARDKGGPGEALVAYAERRGNVLLEHVAAPLTAADFFQLGQPDDWHDRDVEVRVNPLEMRRQRQGRVNEADLALGKLILSSQYAVVGLLEQLEETYNRIVGAVAPEHIEKINITAIIEEGLVDSHAHDEFQNKDAPPPVSREDLSPEQLDRVVLAVNLDLELYHHAQYLFEVSGNRSRWDEELGTLAKREVLAYGEEYQEASRDPGVLNWRESDRRLCKTREIRMIGGQKMEG
mmetsp:Transcript_16782/g.34407  ORF Transcript_16782/g.34407 Transcript_16782/m.34407 type:complete len:416 (+) Transcript_16782:890-2137(+)